MKKFLLSSRKTEKQMAELNALCAENIKMMILDDLTKIPKVYLSPAIKELCDDIYFWQRGRKHNMRFNITREFADKRYEFPEHLYLISCSTVEVIIGFHRLARAGEIPLLRLGNTIVEGLCRPYELRSTVVKNVYNEELSGSNSLLIDYFPVRVKESIVERDEELSDVSAHYAVPQIGYLRLVHNAMAWITLYDMIARDDLIFTEINNNLKMLRSQLSSLLVTLKEPIDSLRVYVDYLGYTNPGARRNLISW